MSQWFEQTVAAVSTEAQSAAELHQSQLTKPQGSLGQLESIAVQFAAWQASARPKLNEVCVRVFAGDHGICAQGVSAFPQEVTTQMIANFCTGGAAISVLSKALAADFKVVNMGVAHPLLSKEGVVDLQLMPGTYDFSQQAAMPVSIAQAAMQAGAEQVPQHADLCIGGEMGIANTSAASAIYSAVLGLAPAQSVGPGTGVKQTALLKKQTLIEQALILHKACLKTPMGILSCVGGLEIAGLCGYYIKAAQQGIPVLVDGFISTAAALLACEFNPGVRQWLLFAHESAEPAHQHALDYMQAKPLLSLDMRLGEGSGAALAVSILQSALLLHNTMASFNQAGVSHAS